MWLWGSSTSKAEEHGESSTQDANIQEFDDDEFDRLSNCSGESGGFFVVTPSDDVKKLQMELSGLKSDLKTTNVQLENMKRLHCHEIEFKDRLVQQKENQMQALKKEMAEKEKKFRSEIRALEERLDVVSKEAQDQAKDNRTIQNEVADLRRFRQDAERTCQSLQSTNDLLTEQLRMRNEEFQQLEKLNSEMKSRLADQERQTHALEAAAAAQDAMMKDVRTLEESQHQQDLIELARVKRQQTDLLQANEILKEELQRAKGEAAAKSEELNRQAIRMNDFENLKSKYMSMRDELKTELVQAHEASAKMAKQLEDLQASSRTQSQEVARLRQLEMDRTSEIKRLSDELRGLSEALEGKTLQLNAAKEEARSSKAELEDARQALQATKQELERQTGRLERMQQGVEEVTRQVDSTVISSAEVNRIQGKYRAEVARIMKENPNCIPIRCVRAPNCDAAYPLLEKKKFAAPKDMTLSRFNEHIRQKMKLDQDRPLSVYIDSVVPLPSSELLEDIYSFCKGIDGFLHLKYSHVSEEAP
eukprot:EG_transcript_6495